MMTARIEGSTLFLQSSVATLAHEEGAVSVPFVAGWVKAWVAAGSGPKLRRRTEPSGGL
jgi:hypothetical protein